jgi:hypothetical protein
VIGRILVNFSVNHLVFDSLTHIVSLFFTPGLPEFDIRPQNKTVKEDSINVTFTCSASGNPSPTLAWSKDGIAINQNDTNVLLGENKQTITIGKVQRSDAGAYICSAINKIKTVSVSAYLNVQCEYNFSEHLF